MKQLFLVQSKGIIVEEVPPPVLLDNNVLVRVAYSLVSSGTESSEVKSKKSLAGRVLKQPELISKVAKKLSDEGIQKTIGLIKNKVGKLIPMGYSCAGTVIEVGGNAKGISVGDRVACVGGGYAAHAEIVSVPRNLTALVPECVKLDEAAFVALGGIAMQGIRRANVTFGEIVVVVGLGVVGQLVCEILKVAGCRVIAIDIAEYRVSLAKQLGADYAFISSEDDVDKVTALTDGIGADAVLICASSSSSGIINQAMKMLRDKGKISVIGAVGMDLKRDDLYNKELDFFISRSYGPGRYDTNYEEKSLDYPIGYVRWTERRNMQEYLHLVGQKKLNIRPIISKVYSIGQGKEAYDNSSKADILGILFKYGDNLEGGSAGIIEVTAKNFKSDNVNVAVIGGGEFATGVHLPNVKRISGVNLKAIVTATGGKAKQLAKEFGAEYCATDYKEVIGDSAVDAIIVSTRHNLHAPLAVAAAKSKKNIFIEKPLCLTYAQCQDVAAAVEKNNVLLSVGFNRRRAPLSVKMKAVFDEIKFPKMIIYRVNAGPLPADHWVYDPIEGGGRLLAEGCHFFDWFAWFTNEEPLAVSAYKPEAGGGLRAEDSFVCQIKFSRGSTASLVYSGAGDTGAGKEHIEVLADKVSGTLDDFKLLRVTGGANVDIKKRSINKGHYQFLNDFFQAVQGRGELPATVFDGVRATVCCLKALESISTGQTQAINWKDYLNGS